MFQAPVAPIASVSANARGSHAAWKRSSSGSGTTGPCPPRPPRSAWLVWLMECSWSARQAGADHRIARHERGQGGLVQAFGPGGPLRQHEVAQLGGRIPHADFGVLGQHDAELGQYA